MSAALATPAVLLALKVLAGIVANLAFVTEFPVIVKAVEPVTSPVCVALETNPEYKVFGELSPVFEPETVVVPVTARVGVELPERVTPFTVLGVIAPRERVIAGVVVAVATVPDIPLAEVTETEVTVPVLPE